MYAITTMAEPPTTPEKIDRLERLAIDRIAAVPALMGMSDGSVRSFIRATAYPRAALGQLSTDGLGLEPVVDAMTVTTSTPLLAHCLLAFEQPRNRSKGQRFASAEPRFGELPDGTTHIHFRSATHMRDVQRDVIARSLPGALALGRHVEILETGVRRNVVVELAYVTFDDSTEPQWILNIRDGISRWSTMLAALLGFIPGEAFSPAPDRRRDANHGDADRTPSSSARAIADAVVPIRRLATARTSKALVMAGVQRHVDLVSDYEANTTSNQPDVEVGPSENMWALVLRQFAVIPATVILRALGSDGAPSSNREAAESLVADLHTGVDSWDGDDRRLFDSKRALRAMWADGILSDDEATLWLGLRPVEDVDIVFPPAGGPDPSRAGIRFATQFYARLLGPDRYETVKAYLRSKPGGRYSFARAVDVLSPLANQHWDRTKPLSRLWSYQGGPVVEDAVRHHGLALTCPPDYRALVPPALNGDSAARAELVLAGGAALLCDHVLTTTLIGGSGSSTERLSFRGSTREIFDLLSSDETGLMSLALAANHFDPKTDHGDVRHRKVDLGADDGVARDTARSPVRLFERDIATVLSDAKAGRDLAQDPGRDSHSPSGPRDTQEAQLSRQLDSIPGHVARVEQATLEALDLQRRSGIDDLGFNEETADALAEKLTKASTTIARLTR